MKNIKSLINVLVEPSSIPIVLDNKGCEKCIPFIKVACLLTGKVKKNNPKAVQAHSRG